MKRRAFLSGTGAVVSGAALLGGPEIIHLPKLTIPTPISFGLCAGQSNDKGKGDAATSATPDGELAKAVVDGEIAPLRDPFGAGEHRAESGSAWPAFADELTRRSEQPIALSQASVGSTTQSSIAADEDGSWAAGSEHVDSAIGMAQESLQVLSDEGYEPTFDGVFWSLGEGDAQAIDEGVITPNDYASAFGAMVEYVRDEVGHQVPFYVWQTGMPAPGDTPGFQAVRREQAKFPARIDGVYLVSRVQKTFPKRGMMNPEPDVRKFHYDQAGYNLMGRVGARSIVAHGGL